jgi:hypothetical protein
MLRQTRIMTRKQQTCLHVLALREQGEGYVEYDARRCRRAQNGSGTCELLAGGDDGAEVIVRVQSPLPFVSPHFCYRVLVQPEDALNNTIRVFGCLDVKCDTAETTHSAILHAAVHATGVKNAKQKVIQCTKSIGLGDDAFAKLVWVTFRQVQEREALMAAVKHGLAAATGWFTRESRQLGAALFCIGFRNRECIMRELQVEECAQETWFLSLGDADLEWEKYSEIDLRYETFGAFIRSFNGRREDFIASVEKIIKMDPERFFCTNTRPMALRAIGALNKDYFMAYCATLEPPLILDGHRLVSVDPENVDEEIFVEDATGDTVFATCDMDGMTVQRCAVTAMTSLLSAHKRGRLLLVREHDLVNDISAASRRLVDWHAHAFDQRGGISEVHVFAATRRICLVFSEASASVCGEAAARAFVCGHAPRVHAHVYFRDAHLLACNVFSHLLWRLSKRVAFTGVTLSDRCSDDKTYHSLLWAFIRRLKEEGTAPLEGGLRGAAPCVANLDRSSLAHLQGVCVVPLASDACCASDAALGDYVFTISPPLFGTIAKVKGNVFVIATMNGSREVARWLFRRQNVLRCKRTAKGAYIVPASALLALRSGAASNLQAITLLLPKSLNAAWQADMQALCQGVATVVNVVRVESYVMQVDADERFETILKLVQDSLK